LENNFIINDYEIVAKIKRRKIKKKGKQRLWPGGV
jgi:hypothetical protein